MSVFVIAEAGVNHNGDIVLARKLVKAAKDCGADAVKFQTFSAGALASASAGLAEYQKRNTESVESQLAMLQKLELSVDAHKELKSYCEDLGITFLSSAFDLESIQLLKDLGLKKFKIPSGEITNKPYLNCIAEVADEVIMSTGMSDSEEIAAALTVLTDSGLSKSKVTLLHCTTEYPTPLDEVNLNAMVTLREIFGTAVGYSDHTAGTEVAVAAVALGATIIEKHFTLDRNLPGPDHKASLEPAELKAMITQIRNIEKAMGDGEKKATSSESQNMSIVRKSIHLAAAVAAGEVLTEQHLTTKRPGDGISPMKIHDVIGKKAKHALDADVKLSLDDLVP